MSDAPGYATALGVESAIKTAAERAAEDDPTVSIGKRIELEHFNRFLSRVFSEEEDAGWVLKGGTGMLARVPGSRDTRDIDLFRTDAHLAEALEALIRIAAIDLGDHFRFEYAGHRRILGADTQPYVDGYRVQFNVFLGLRAKGKLNIDLAVGTALTGEITRQHPEGRLDLPSLVSHPYRLYPVVDQIADKVCATMTSFSGKESSREKDLVDLVVLALTQTIDGSQLRTAILTESARRQMTISEFSVPRSWGLGYSRLSSMVSHCADYRTVERATTLVRALIEPALNGSVEGWFWSPQSTTWRE